MHFLTAALLVMTSLTPASSEPAPAACTAIVGSNGRSGEGGSGWLDLASPMDVVAGDTLRFVVAGSARRVVLRLLPKGAAADSPTGIIGEYTVGPGGRIQVVVAQAARQIVQFSVHGMRNPWGLYDLGAANGPAIIISVRSEEHTSELQSQSNLV